MFEKARHIVVEGPIGAGKTPLARRLAERLSALPLLEKPEDNPFLTRFYQGAGRYALHSQLHFLFKRLDLLKQQANIDRASQRVVADFLLDKDPAFASLSLDDNEYALFRRAYDSMKPVEPYLPIPDLVIYLQADPATLVERARRRGDEAEKKVNIDFLVKLTERFARFFHQYDAAPVFIVNAGSLDPAGKDEDFELLWQRLSAMRSYREYFGYAN